jgi:transcriptional regulator with GAF, ATPase, and Fis domain
MESKLEQLNEEKQRLETLYTSGILFTSETEMKTLLGKAIDTVIKELRADAGFIILTDEEGEIDSIFARNMNPDEEPDARDLSTSVIRNTLSRKEPPRLEDFNGYLEDSINTSIVRLGIKSVLCVPLIADKTMLGAVYLDRRESEQPFTENELVFLISFARQIVQGMEISREITLLENKLLREAEVKLEDLRQSFKCPEIIGSGRKLFEVLLMASKIAPTSASVIILGENGTGKELLARAIHNNSRRADKPFVAINCSAIPHDLLESELFGYEAGAFTGAKNAKPGKIEMADHGTLFLDEICELDINLQAKLLRVLQQQEIERLGSITHRKVDIRILAATNRNIAEKVRKGEFREDLYYRLKVIEITIPPLRERKEDIGELAEFFLRKHAKDSGPQQITHEALEILENYAWPGNIRELENVILRGIVLTKGNFIDVCDLPPELVDTEVAVPRIKPGKTLEEAEAEFRRRYILRTLHQTSTKSEAARVLGVNRTHFYRMLAQLDIED